jgi:class 3 adenylate cyclase
MALKDDLNSEVSKIFKSAWTERDGQVVPTDESIGLGNDAANLEATVLYADLADSTVLVDTYKPWFAAEIYKCFLHCAAKVIRANGGAITAYDGDRVMAVYIGDAKNSSAVKTSMQLHWAVKNIIQPALEKQYPNTDFQLKHVVGIDTSDLFVARTGIRGNNDLVWVGRAANYAAKLSSLSDSYSKYITEEVYERLREDVKYSNGRSMWEAAPWDSFDGRTIYRSTWWMSID